MESQSDAVKRSNAKLTVMATALGKIVRSCMMVSLKNLAAIVRWTREMVAINRARGVSMRRIR